MDDLWLSYRTRAESTSRRGRHARHRHRIDAIRGVTFGVPEGMVVGVIGRNGAGKSTLLRTIAGILPPTSGRITVRGQVATLLSLGIGFNPELTGRDNVILGGMATGLARDEVVARFDAIEAFAELGDALDFPVRSYSSGMVGRLGFAVASHMEADILLIDEALSTGDAAFREKSLAKMRQMCEEARTVLIVSHGLALVRQLADRCIWLDQGRIRGAGSTHAVVDEYLDVQHLEYSGSVLDDA